MAITALEAERLAEEEVMPAQRLDDQQCVLRAGELEGQIDAKIRANKKATTVYVPIEWNDHEEMILVVLRTKYIGWEMKFATIDTFVPEKFGSGYSRRDLYIRLKR